VRELLFGRPTPAQSVPLKQLKSYRIEIGSDGLLSSCALFVVAVASGGLPTGVFFDKTGGVSARQASDSQIKNTYLFFKEISFRIRVWNMSE
jgi:hypothetical protein